MGGAASISVFDIKLKPRVKVLPLVARANAFVLKLRAQSSAIQDDVQKIAYLVRAHQCVCDALHSNPTNAELNQLEGEILSLEATLLSRVKDPSAIKPLRRARRAFERAIESDPTHVEARLRLAQLLQRDGNVKDEAVENLYLAALEVDSCNVDALRHYSNFLVDKHLAHVGEEFLARRDLVLQGQASIANELSKSGAVELRHSSNDTGGKK